MRQRLTKIALYVGICFLVLFVLQAVFIPFMQSQATQVKEQLPTEPFALGQYYFNYSNQADGEYDLKRARTYYEEVIRENPQANDMVWYQLGRIDFLEGNFDAALFKFAKQLEYFGDARSNVFYMIGLTHGYKARQTQNPEDWQKAADGFATFLTFVPASPWARTDLAWIYFAEGKFNDMKPVLELGLIQNPEHPWLLNMYGLYLHNTDRKELANEYFARAAAAAAALEVVDWGRAYPGNNPEYWGEGLEEFQDVIKFNQALPQDSV